MIVKIDSNLSRSPVEVNEAFLSSLRSSAMLGFSTLRAMRTIRFSVAAAVCLSTFPAVAQPVTFRTPVAVILPLTEGWFNGEPAPYISTEASDQAVARAMHANYDPRLGNAANTQAVDDIYAITNYKQGNIIPSHPHPEGPNNRDTNYTPLWQVSMITWNDGSSPYLLTSEKAVLDVVQKGLATRVKTNIIVNCSVMFTPSGGLFPRATLLNHYKP